MAKKAAKVITRTFLPKIFSNTIFSTPLPLKPRTPLSYKLRGFSLVEILIVLGILAAVISFGTPRLNFKQGNLKSTYRHLSVLSRELRQNARMKQKVFRLAFDLNLDPQTYWVESGALADLDRPIQEDEDGKKIETFPKDTLLIKADKVLPIGVRIKAVLSSGPQPTDDQKKHLYIHYYPSGMTDAAVIVFEQNNKISSLIVQPLTGRTEIVEQEVKLEDLFIQ